MKQAHYHKVYNKCNKPGCYKIAACLRRLSDGALVRPEAVLVGDNGVEVSVRPEGHLYPLFDRHVIMTSDSMHRHNLEMLLSRNSIELEQKLRELYDPAISKLLSAPSAKYDSKLRRVKIETPIATEANLGPYSIKVDYVTPIHMTGTLKPKTVSATVKADWLDYKYSADMELCVYE